MLLILNTACLGISASLLLKYLNSILKAFSTAIEMTLTAILSYLIFSIPVSRLTNYLAFITVSFAIYLYALNPIKERPERNPSGYEKVPDGPDDKERSEECV